MISFVLKNFKVILKNIGLYGSIKNIQYGLPHSTYHLYSILEIYNFKSEMFFTPIGELNFALHEMFEVLLLSMGELPYKEMVSTLEKLRQMRTEDPQVYETYWEVMCHF